MSEYLAFCQFVKTISIHEKWNIFFGFRISAVRNETVFPFLSSFNTIATISPILLHLILYQPVLWTKSPVRFASENKIK